MFTFKVIKSSVLTVYTINYKEETCKAVEISVIKSFKKEIVFFMIIDVLK